MKNPIFEIKNVSVSKSNVNILSIKKFDIHRSACYLINGNMASGKTLILDLLAKKNISYKGNILYEGKELKKINYLTQDNEIKYVTQNFKAPYFKTVKGFIGKIASSNSKFKNDKSVNDIIKKMDFKYIANHKMRDLTPGQLRWVNLAANIASFPKILLIDELELHLSMSKIKNLCKILYRKVNYEGITIIATTQNKDFFHSLPSVQININNGRITSVRSKVKNN
tara:strand:+ start:293 stop:967 length:675 start_codon:yes stop_codon:yes gene_type:complete